MKVAIVISQFPCSDEVFILRELRALQLRGIELRIFSLRPSHEPVLHADTVPLLGCVRYSPLLASWTVFARNLRLLFTQPGLYLGLLARVVREMWSSPPFLWRSIAVFPVAVRWGMELREEGADRIHAHWATHPATAGWIMSRITGIPLSVTAHAHDIYLDQAMLPFKLREAVAVLTCTRQNLDFLRELAPDVPEGRVRLSYHGLDLDLYRPDAGDPETFRILSVGSLLPRKGFDILVEACALLEKAGVAHECVIVGGGPMRPELDAQVARLGVKSVRFLGKQSQEQLPAIYRRSSAFVLAALHSDATPSAAKAPSASDFIHYGIPNVILEAMASGLPVVTTRMPALGEVLRDGENGVYVPERDPAALAAALRELAENPERRRRMGANAAVGVRKAFDIRVTSGEVAEALGMRAGA